MAQCGQNLGSKFFIILMGFGVLSITPKVFADYADDKQHGGVRSGYFDEETWLFHSDSIDQHDQPVLGRLHFDVANPGDDTVPAVKTLHSKENLNPETPKRPPHSHSNFIVKDKDVGINYILHVLKRSLQITNDVLKAEDIPLNDLLFFQLEDQKKPLSSSQKDILIEALADNLQTQKDHVFINDNIVAQPNIIAIYVIDQDVNPSLATVNDLLPAHQLHKNLIVNQLLSKLPDNLQIENIFTTISLEELMLSSRGNDDRDAIYMQQYFPYVVACSGIVLIALVISLIWFCAFRTPSKEQQSSQYSSVVISPASSCQSSTAVPQQICTLFPAGKPDLHHPTHIQPNVSPALSSRSLMGIGGYGSPMHHLGGSVSPLATGSISPRSGLSETPCSSPSSGTPLTGSSTPIHTPPLRVRAKLGLLERRGSNASLTIDLGPSTGQSSQDTASSWGSPPRESSAEEYLLSAGNRMSRKQLRSCLKNVRAIHEEFWEIPMNHPDRIEVAGSGMKNRYRTIIPNEETRVKLTDCGDDSISSYINANYIRGYGSEPRSYIATQGPMSNTVCDFWLMVWQEKAPIIVMITKLREKNRTKCESYLPEISGRFGDIEVISNTISERNGYILRNLTLKRGSREHSVLHYWYTAWPDHKAPSTAKTLLDLVKLVDQQRYDPQTGKVTGPVVVHCSAGIGRTGCFIAASIGIQQLRCERMVDILGTICSMRIDRGGMIQTNEQYEFLHQILCLFERELPERPPSNGEE